jgi:hypothetical protein
MKTCSLHSRLEIVAGDWADYKGLARYHYRDEQPAGVKAIFSVKPGRRLHSSGSKAMGVIVYTMPVPRMEQRNAATGDLFKGFDRQTQLALINRNIRCISRVIIEPRLRGIGLATRLVRETMPLMNVPIIEALGVMPLVNPFLEKAGMKAFAPRIRPEQVELIEAFSVVGIEENDLIDAEIVQRKLDALCPSAANFVEAHVYQFLRSQGRRRTMPPGIERTRYILGKLAERPAYHIWFHPTLEVTLA